jgi:hypothetical protein
MAGFFIYGSVTLKNLNTNNNNLTNQIQAQSEAQQQAVLLKDRLEKIRKVYTLPNASKNFIAVSSIVNSLSSDAKVVEMDISAEKNILSLSFKTNGELTNFMNKLASQEDFTGITLESFTYNPTSGYVVGIAFSGK